MAAGGPALGNRLGVVRNDSCSLAFKPEGRGMRADRAVDRTVLSRVEGTPVAAFVV
jgi:hypothetical protein